MMPIVSDGTLTFERSFIVQPLSGAMSNCMGAMLFLQWRNIRQTGRELLARCGLGSRG
jgi:hypothetical protein